MLRSPRACPGRQLPKYGVPTGLLYGAFYVLTALAAVAYYRRRVLASARNAVMLGVLPLGAAAFLTWVLWKSLAAAPAGQLWSVTSILAAGIIQAHERACGAARATTGSRRSFLSTLERGHRWRPDLLPPRPPPSPPTSPRPPARTAAAPPVALAAPTRNLASP